MCLIWMYEVVLGEYQPQPWGYVIISPPQVTLISQIWGQLAELTQILCCFLSETIQQLGWQRMPIPSLSWLLSVSFCFATKTTQKLWFKSLAFLRQRCSSNYDGASCQLPTSFNCWVIFYGSWTSHSSQNLRWLFKLFDTLLSDGAQPASTISYNASHGLIVDFISIQNSEGARASQTNFNQNIFDDNSLLLVSEREAFRVQISKLIVVYSKISLHFHKDWGIFCEGEWEH